MTARDDFRGLLGRIRIVPPEREPEPRPEPEPTFDQQPFWQQLVEIHAAWASGDAGARPGAYWHGAVGCGKTFLARMFVRAARRAGWSTFSGHLPDLVTETQSAMAREEGSRSTHAMLGAIREARIVFLDELHLARTPHAQDLARQLVNASAERFLIVTANVDAIEIAKRHNDEGLASRLLALEQVEWPASMPDLRVNGSE